MTSKIRPGTGEYRIGELAIHIVGREDSERLADVGNIAIEEIHRKRAGECCITGDEQLVVAGGSEFDQEFAVGRFECSCRRC